jgi:hypothetical protein
LGKKKKRTVRAGNVAQWQRTYIAYALNLITSTTEKENFEKDLK